MRDRRNGTYPRHLLSELGDIELSVPRTRRFCPTEVLKSYARRAPEIDRVILAGFVLGLSTRKVGKVPLALLARTVSSASVSPVATMLFALELRADRRDKPLKWPLTEGSELHAEQQSVPEKPVPAGDERSAWQSEGRIRSDCGTKRPRAPAYARRRRRSPRLRQQPAVQVRAFRLKESEAELHCGRIAPAEELEALAKCRLAAIPRSHVGLDRVHTFRHQSQRARTEADHAPEREPVAHVLAAVGVGAGERALHHTVGPNWLKAWALRLAKLRGKKRATVALARRIGVVLHRIWRGSTEFRFTREEAMALPTT